MYYYPPRQKSNTLIILMLFIFILIIILVSYFAYTGDLDKYILSTSSLTTGKIITPPPSGTTQQITPQNITTQPITPQNITTPPITSQNRTTPPITSQNRTTPSTEIRSPTVTTEPITKVANINCVIDEITTTPTPSRLVRYIKISNSSSGIGNYLALRQLIVKDEGSGYASIDKPITGLGSETNLRTKSIIKSLTDRNYSSNLYSGKSYFISNDIPGFESYAAFVMLDLVTPKDTNLGISITANSSDPSFFKTYNLELLDSQKNIIVTGKLGTYLGQGFLYRTQNNTPQLLGPYELETLNEGQTPEKNGYKFPLDPAIGFQVKSVRISNVTNVPSSLKISQLSIINSDGINLAASNKSSTFTSPSSNEDNIDNYIKMDFNDFTASPLIITINNRTDLPLLLGNFQLELLNKFGTKLNSIDLNGNLLNIFYYSGGIKNTFLKGPIDIPSGQAQSLFKNFFNIKSIKISNKTKNNVPLSISQIAVVDNRNLNLAPDINTSVSASPSDLENSINFINDGILNPRNVPNIYSSVNAPDNFLQLTLNESISQPVAITIYNRDDECFKYQLRNYQLELINIYNFTISTFDLTEKLIQGFLFDNNSIVPKDVSNNELLSVSQGTNQNISNSISKLNFRVKEKNLRLGIKSIKISNRTGNNAYLNLSQIVVFNDQGVNLATYIDPGIGGGVIKGDIQNVQSSSTLLNNFKLFNGNQTPRSKPDILFTTSSSNNYLTIIFREVTSSPLAITIYNSYTNQNDLANYKLELCDINSNTIVKSDLSNNLVQGFFYQGAYDNPLITGPINIDNNSPLQLESNYYVKSIRISNRTGNSVPLSLSQIAIIDDQNVNLSLGAEVSASPSTSNNSSFINDGTYLTRKSPNVYKSESSSNNFVKITLKEISKTPLAITIYNSRDNQKDLENYKLELFTIFDSKIAEINLNGDLGQSFLYQFFNYCVNLSKMSLVILNTPILFITDKLNQNSKLTNPNLAYPPLIKYIRISNKGFNIGNLEISQLKVLNNTLDLALKENGGIFTSNLTNDLYSNWVLEINNKLFTDQLAITLISSYLGSVKNYRLEILNENKYRIWSSDLTKDLIQGFRYNNNNKVPFSELSNENLLFPSIEGPIIGPFINNSNILKVYPKVKYIKISNRINQPSKLTISQIVVKNKDNVNIAKNKKVDARPLDLQSVKNLVDGIQSLKESPYIFESYDDNKDNFVKIDLSEDADIGPLLITIYNREDGSLDDQKKLENFQLEVIDETNNILTEADNLSRKVNLVGDLIQDFTYKISNKGEVSLFGKGTANFGLIPQSLSSISSNSEPVKFITIAKSMKGYKGGLYISQIVVRNSEGRNIALRRPVNTQKDEGSERDLPAKILNDPKATIITDGMESLRNSPNIYSSNFEFLVQIELIPEKPPFQITIYFCNGCMKDGVNYLSNFNLYIHNSHDHTQFLASQQLNKNLIQSYLYTQEEGATPTLKLV